MTKSQNLTKEKAKQLHSIDIPKYIQNQWRRLFTKELYGIGKDILHKDNLLLQYGFTRQRPPNSDMGSSQYSLTDKDDQIILWAFGMVFATKNDGLFLWRHEFEPKLLNVNLLLPNLWEANQLPQRTIPKTTEETLLMLQLLVKSMKWLENYEEWILTTCGQTYRSESLQGKFPSDTRHLRLDEKWHDLSEKFSKILKKNYALCK